MNFKRYKSIVALAMVMVGVLLLPFSSFAASPGKYTVVIDAGHGGKDPGAMDNNVQEKDINLAVALKLGDLIKKNLKNVKVVYTRSDDNFISLEKRAEIANKAKADLFISIHTNSLDASNPNRTVVGGSSVYVLGLHKEKDNNDVARRENSVICLEDHQERYDGFDPNSDESYIIFELAQKGNLTKSIKFADDVQKQLVKVAKRADRGVHQAGFWVLWATSMPSVLIELDFICNPNSAKYMASPQGRDQMAEAIFNSVKNYFKTLDAERSAHSVPEVVTKSENMAVLPPFVEEPVKEFISSGTASNNKTSAQRRRRSAASKKSSEARNLEKSDLRL